MLFPEPLLRKAIMLVIIIISLLVVLSTHYVTCSDLWLSGIQCNVLVIGITECNVRVKISTREDTRHVFSTIDWSKLFFHSCDVMGHTPNLIH
jgi:hypothetical protein